MRTKSRGEHRTLTEDLRLADRYGEPEPVVPDFDMEQDGSAELVNLHQRIEQMEDGPIPHPRVADGRALFRVLLGIEVADHPTRSAVIDYLDEVGWPGTTESMRDDEDWDNAREVA